LSNLERKNSGQLEHFDKSVIQILTW